MNTSVSGRYYYVLPAEQAARSLADFQVQLARRAAAGEPAAIRFNGLEQAREAVGPKALPPAGENPMLQPMEGVSAAAPQRLIDLLAQERGRDLARGVPAAAPGPSETAFGPLALARLAGMEPRLQQIHGRALEEMQEAAYGRQAFAEGSVGMARRVPVLIDLAV